MTCIQCGSARAALTAGVCQNSEGCRARRIRRRIDEDRKRGGKQCIATIGSTSIRFCVREKHTGKHANGVTEWGNDERTAAGEAVAAVLKAAVAQ